MSVFDTYKNFNDSIKHNMAVSHWKKLNQQYHEEYKKNMVPLTQAQKNEIDEYFMTYFGFKIPYYGHEMYSSISGNFDVRFVPLWFYYSYFEYYLNNNLEYAHTLENKNLLKVFADSCDVATPEVVWANCEGLNLDGEGSIIRLEDAVDKIQAGNFQTLFVKPSQDSSSGDGCKLYKEYKMDSDSLMELVKSIDAEYKCNYVVQEQVKNNKSLSDIHPWSVNTFRVVTYLIDGQIKHCPVVMRMGINQAVVDNGSAGGIIVGVEDDGSLQDKAIGAYYDGLYPTHPDTGYEFKGKVISEFPEVIAAAHRMHAQFNQVKIINWDFTLNEDGKPCLIEVNCEHSGGWDYSQVTRGKGAFGDDTEHMYRIVKKLSDMPKAQRDIEFKQGNLWN